MRASCASKAWMKTVENKTFNLQQYKVVINHRHQMRHHPVERVFTQTKEPE